MKDMDRLTLANQIIIMRTLAADTHSPYFHDQLREHVRMSVDALAVYDRDKSRRLYDAARTRALVTGNGRAKR